MINQLSLERKHRVCNHERSGARIVRERLREYESRWPALRLDITSKEEVQPNKFLRTGK